MYDCAERDKIVCILSACFQSSDPARPEWIRASSLSFDELVFHQVLGTVS